MASHLISLLVLSCLTTKSFVFGYYSTVVSKLDGVVYLYPNELRRESDLKVCDGGVEACSIINQRYWLPPHVYRLCKCHHGECPQVYDRNDTRSIFIDNRSQLKMCDDLSEVKTCGEDELGVTIKDVENESDRRRDRKVNIHCKCDYPGYWQLSRHTRKPVNKTSTLIYNQYRCTKLKNCRSGDFCGHVRADTYSTYYKCTCPYGTLCINKDKVIRQAAEILYSGPMYRAYCEPINNNEIENR